MVEAHEYVVRFDEMEVVAKFVYNEANEGGTPG